MSRRLEVLAPQCLPFDFAAQRVAFCRLAKCVGPSMVTTVIKSFTNSWITSHRFHEDKRWPCIFGCEGGLDTFEHYLGCDPLWTILVSCAGLGTAALHDSPVQRLGLANPTKQRFILITLASRCFHGIRMNHSAQVDLAIRERDFSNVQTLLLELALIHFKELC